METAARAIVTRAIGITIHQSINGTARFSIALIFFLVKGESIEIIIFMRISDTLDFLGVMISEHGYRRRSSNEGIIARMS